MLRALRAGGMLGIPMDIASRVPSVDVPLLGSLARTPVGPARLALRTAAAVVVGTAAPNDLACSARDDDAPRHAISATRILSADLAADADGERLLTTRINDELSRRILALPEEWVWMHPRWAAPALR